MGISQLAFQFCLPLEQGHSSKRCYHSETRDATWIPDCHLNMSARENPGAWIGGLTLRVASPYRLERKVARFFLNATEEVDDEPISVIAPVGQVLGDHLSPGGRLFLRQLVRFPDFGHMLDVQQIHASAEANR